MYCLAIPAVLLFEMHLLGSAVCSSVHGVGISATDKFADGKEMSAGELCSAVTLLPAGAIDSSVWWSSPGIVWLISTAVSRGLFVSASSVAAALKLCEYRMVKTKTVESTSSSSSEDLMFLCTTTFHSLLLLWSNLGLAQLLGEGEGGRGAMLLSSELICTVGDDTNATI